MCFFSKSFVCLYVCDELSLVGIVGLFGMVWSSLVVILWSSRFVFEKK